MAHQNPTSSTGPPAGPSGQQENFDRVADNSSHGSTNFDGHTSQLPALSDITNRTSTHRDRNNNDSATIDAQDSDDEDAYMHMSDDQLTRDSETINLRGARNRLWGTEIDQHLDAAAFGQAPQPAILHAVNEKTTSNASDTSGTSGPSTTSAAARAARRMARRVALSANVATTDILGRLINGSARAPGQLYSWVSSGFTSPSSGSESTNTTSYFSINDESVFQPSVSSTSFNTISTTAMGRSSLSPGMYHTPPTSCGGSVNASSTNVASTTDESLDSTDYQLMTAGTLFERGPDGDMVPTSPVQGAAGGVEDGGHDGFEMVFAMDEDTAHAAPTTHDHSHGDGHGHNPHQDSDIMDDTFCVVGSARSNNKSNI